MVNTLFSKLTKQSLRASLLLVLFVGLAT
jgi:hypothetical protein